jgi:hypothetical protein
MVCPGALLEKVVRIEWTIGPFRLARTQVTKQLKAELIDRKPEGILRGVDEVCGFGQLDPPVAKVLPSLAREGFLPPLSW